MHMYMDMVAVVLTAFARTNRLLVINYWLFRTHSCCWLPDCQA